METWGRVASYSDVVTIDSSFIINDLTFVSYSILVGGAGNIVWQNAKGEAQYLPNAQANQLYLIGAQKILSSATVNGINRTTSATSMVWLATNTLYNSP